MTLPSPEVIKQIVLAVDGKGNATLQKEVREVVAAVVNTGDNFDAASVRIEAKDVLPVITTLEKPSPQFPKLAATETPKKECDQIVSRADIPCVPKASALTPGVNTQNSDNYYDTLALQPDNLPGDMSNWKKIGLALGIGAIAAGSAGRRILNNVRTKESFMDKQRERGRKGGLKELFMALVTKKDRRPKVNLDSTEEMDRWAEVDKRIAFIKENPERPYQNAKGQTYEPGYLVFQTPEQLRPFMERLGLHFLDAIPEHVGQFVDEYSNHIDGTPIPQLHLSMVEEKWGMRLQPRFSLHYAEVPNDQNPEALVNTMDGIPAITEDMTDPRVAASAA